jgi:hypothetical protein
MEVQASSPLQLASTQLEEEENFVIELFYEVISLVEIILLVFNFL